jgi:anthranilate phosphoribosyltransferase
MSELKIQDAIKRVVEKKSLNEEEAYNVCIEIMEGNATPAQIASLLTALRMKGETVEEISGFCKAMRTKMMRINCQTKNLVDTCGTGGDGMYTFNISTSSAFIVAGAGCHVAKHGNKSASGFCGSADLLAGLKIKIDLTPEQVKECIEKTGIGFIFAPLFHPAMKFAIGPRKEIGIRTIFNLLGPLCNPACVKRQVIGVPKKEFMDKITGVLKNIGTEHTLVVCGGDGIDEITTTGKTYIQEIKGGNVTSYEILPEDFGIKRCHIDKLKVASFDESIDAFYEVIKGRPGPKTDIAILNAGAGIYVSGKAKTLEQGVELARKAVFTGLAFERFKELRRFINESSKGNPE